MEVKSQIVLGVCKFTEILLTLCRANQVNLIYQKIKAPENI